MRFGITEILLLAVVVILLFGRGRISEIMGDFGKGLRSFKSGLKGEDESKPAPDKAEKPD